MEYSGSRILNLCIIDVHIVHRYLLAGARSLNSLALFRDVDQTGGVEWSSGGMNEMNPHCFEVKMLFTPLCRT